jgi:hypothetical protein
LQLVCQKQVRENQVLTALTIDNSRGPVDDSPLAPGADQLAEIPARNSSPSADGAPSMVRHQPRLPEINQFEKDQQPLEAVALPT